MVSPPFQCSMMEDDPHFQCRKYNLLLLLLLQGDSIPATLSSDNNSSEILICEMLSPEKQVNLFYPN